MNPDRRVSSLLLTQVEHTHAAEKRLPHRYHSDIYVNAIKTEGEAARYISEVTKAIHRAHEDAAKQRSKSAPKSGRRLRLAAAADERSKSNANAGVARSRSKARRNK
jgi:hypothetical protein